MTSVCSVDLEVDATGLHLLVGDGEGDDVQLHYLNWELDAAAWSSPELLPTKPHAIKGINMGNPARLAVSPSKIYTIWQKSGRGWGGRGPMVGLSSDKAAMNWRALPLPKASVAGGDQGFYDLVASDDEQLHLIWLAKVESRDHKGLFYARSRYGGEHWTQSHCVAEPTCMCCRNSLTLSTGGQLVALYRQAAPRDMAVALWSPASASWRKIGPAGAFDWDFRGCPHVGGALVVDEDSSTIHSAVWTGRADKQGLYVTDYNLTKNNWSQPVPLGGSSAKHMDMVEGPLGNHYLVWDERVSSRSSIMLSVKNRGSWSQPRLLSGRQDASHPSCVVLGEELHVLWLRSDAGIRSLSHVRVDTKSSPLVD